MNLTGDGLFIGLIILACFFMLVSFRKPNILVALVTFIMWFSLGLWLFLSTQAPVGFGEAWKDILGWGFLVASFLPWVFQMNVEIRNEKNGHSWTSYGEEPREVGPTGYEAYRDLLYNRTRKNRRK
jgi:hypothetical protein